MNSYENEVQKKENEERIKKGWEKNINQNNISIAEKAGGWKLDFFLK